jgi:hypothetical protein
MRLRPPSQEQQAKRNGDGPMPNREQLSPEWQYKPYTRFL